MLATVNGNTILIDEDIRAYDGTKVTKTPINWDSFIIPSERGENVEEYMKEMRENDRL